MTLRVIEFIRGDIKKKTERTLFDTYSTALTGRTFTNAQRMER